MSAPALAPGIRFRRVRDGHAVLLVPEGVVNLNASAAAIVELIDGSRDVSNIASELKARYDADLATVTGDIEELVRKLSAKGWLFVSQAEPLR